APPYDALSYTWGHAYINVESRCDGHIFRIRPHLRDALLRIRLSDQSTYLWADAICIDQSNVQERGHQVGIMRQIYQHAKQVVVWLG
ncbi:heterokaryon incompatibility, partial [Cadophora sp. DSE1049]